MISDSQIAYASFVCRQGRSRPFSRNHSSNMRVNSFIIRLWSAKVRKFRLSENKRNIFLLSNVRNLFNKRAQNKSTFGKAKVQNSGEPQRIRPFFSHFTHHPPHPHRHRRIYWASSYNSQSSPRCRNSFVQTGSCLSYHQ